MYSESDFPLEYFIKLENNDYYDGRIIVNKYSRLDKSEYSVEIDIVNIESRKIYQHVDILYGVESVDEATHLGVQKLSNFIINLKTS